MKSLNIGDLKLEKPIIQGGMGVGVSLSRLASAVANEGGMGVIAPVGIGFLEKDFFQNPKEANLRALRNEICTAKKESGGVIGVNVMVALNDFDDIIKVCVDEKVDAILMGAGLPVRLPSTVSLERLKKSGIKTIIIVSSSTAAKIILKKWDRNFGAIPDAFVVEGPLAGGHLGFKKDHINSPQNLIENIIPLVKEEIVHFEKKYNKRIPVFAAGGIFNGSDIFDIIKKGADGVQMGTRFVATLECDAHENFKKEYINCKKEDIVIIDSPVGMPGRAIFNSFIKKVRSGAKFKINCSWHCLKYCDIKKAQYCIAEALTNAKKGLVEKGFAFAGANAYRIKEIISVKKLFNDLIEEFNEALEIESLCQALEV